MKLSAPPCEQRMAMKIKEQDVQRTIIAWLRLKRFFFWRNNVGAAMYSNGKHRRFIRFGTPGAPDIFVIVPSTIGTCIVWGIEVKAPQKGKQSVEQRMFEEDFTRAGGNYILALSLDDVIARMG